MIRADLGRTLCARGSCRSLALQPRRMNDDHSRWTRMIGDCASKRKSTSRGNPSNSLGCRLAPSGAGLPIMSPDLNVRLSHAQFFRVMYFCHWASSILNREDRNVAQGRRDYRTVKGRISPIRGSTIPERVASHSMGAQIMVMLSRLR
jgi:hypothetical protein